MRDFVRPKVDPIIENNQIMKSWMGSTNSASLKQVGDNFIYFRGSWDPSSAISISAHVLVNDEVDRSNPKTLRTFRSRLDAAKFTRPDMGWIWEFSNPSRPGKGVHERYEWSDQKHWFIKCPHCNEWQYMSWPESVDIEREIYICGKCKRELSDDDRRVGEWVAKWPRRTDISGYWISQLHVPVIPAKKVIKESLGDPEVFYNFTLGLPYVSKDMQLTVQAITQCLSPDENPMIGNAMGVDVGVVKHYVIGNQYGIFRIGETQSWEEIEDLRNRYNAYMVIDANPYPHTPRKLVERYPGKVFMHYFAQDKKQLGIIRWGDGDKAGIVESDRTKIIDAVVADIQSQDVTYNLTQTEMEPYINHAVTIYRTSRVTPQGIEVPIWETIDGKADHYLFAHVYFKVALEKQLTQSAMISVSPDNSKDIPFADATGRTVVMDDVAADASASTAPVKDWKSI